MWNNVFWPNNGIWYNVGLWITCPSITAAFWRKIGLNYRPFQYHKDIMISQAKKVGGAESGSKIWLTVPVRFQNTECAMPSNIFGLFLKSKPALTNTRDYILGSLPDPRRQARRYGAGASRHVLNTATFLHWKRRLHELWHELWFLLPRPQLLGQHRRRAANSLRGRQLGAESTTVGDYVLPTRLSSLYYHQLEVMEECSGYNVSVGCGQEPPSRPALPL